MNQQPTRKEYQRRPQEVKQIYAHLHRLLAQLLTNLTHNTPTFWLDADPSKHQHHIQPDGTRNTYAKAVYLTPTLQPYNDHLNQLSRVQTHALELMSSTAGLEAQGKIPRGLMLPQVIPRVDHAILSRHTSYSSHAYPKAEVVTKLKALLEAQQANLRLNFEPYASTIDPRREQVEEDITKIAATLDAIAASQDTLVRERRAHDRVRPYISTHDPRTTAKITLLPHVRDVGLILEADIQTVHWQEEARKPVTRAMSARSAKALASTVVPGKAITTRL